MTAFSCAVADASEVAKAIELGVGAGQSLIGTDGKVYVASAAACAALAEPWVRRRSSRERGFRLARRRAAVPMPNGIWLPLIAGLFGTLAGSIATILSAFINRQPTLASILDSRIATVMQIYERTIGELRTEICRLQEKIDIYEKTIMDLRDHIAQLEAKIDILKVRLNARLPAPEMPPANSQVSS